MSASIDLRRRGDYGIDGDFKTVSAAGQVAIVGTVCAALGAFTVVSAVAGWVVVAVITGLVTVWLLMTVAFYAYTTRVGKFTVWAHILAGLGLRGDEDLLDLGCGRGAVLLAAAKLLPDGHAVGIDLWQADQTGNSPETTRRNAELEGVAARVTLHTGDITSLPFDDRSFDVIVSSFVLHNLPTAAKLVGAAPGQRSTAAGREAAIGEAVRVLRPGGRILLVDLAHTGAYRAQLASLGLVDARRRNLGWRVWWGGPWFPSRLVSARRSRA